MGNDGCWDIRAHPTTLGLPSAPKIDKMHPYWRSLSTRSLTIDSFILDYPGCHATMDRLADKAREGPTLLELTHDGATSGDFWVEIQLSVVSAG